MAFISGQESVVVGIADIKFGRAPLVIRTNLGSCIAICLFDSVNKVGGLLHFMLPYSTCVNPVASIKKAKYADSGLQFLLDALKQHFSVKPADLVAKVFGGATILRVCTLDIAKRNIEAAYDNLNCHHIDIETSRVGGNHGYKVDFDLNTGKVFCHIFGGTVEEC